MKRLVQILGRVCLFLAFAMASAIAVGGILLYALEKSGWLADYVTAEVQGRLGDSGAQFELGELELDWFGPAVTLYDVRLGVDGRLARINRLSLVVAPFAPPSSRVRRARFDGGRVRLSAELFEALEALGGTERPARPGEAPPVLGSVGEFPPLEINGVQFDVGHPQWGDFPLGAVDAVLARDVRGEAELKGVLAPSLADSGDRNAAVYLRGRVERRGILSLHVSTAGFPVSAAALPPGTPLEALRALQPTGRLALDAMTELSLDPRAPSNVTLRAKLTQGSLTRAETGLALRDLELDLEASCRRDEDRNWFDPLSWDARVQASADWNGAELEAFVRLGQAAGPGRLVRGELRAPGFSVSPESLAELGIWPQAKQAYDALEPHGFADVSLAVAMDEERRISGAVDVVLDGRLTAAFHGWPRHRVGAREGFPLPVEGLRGRFTAAYDTTLQRHFQAGILNVRGTPVDRERDQAAPASPATARIAGSISAPPVGSPRLAGPEVELRFEVTNVSVGEPLRRAIEGLHSTQWIWPAFSPVSGTLDGSGRMMGTVAAQGVGARFEVQPRDLGLSWDGLPIHFARGQGRILLCFDPRQAFGVGFELTGSTATAESVRIQGRVQQDPALAPPLGTRPPPLPPEQVARELLMDFDVAVRGMALRGSDREIVASTWPGVGAALDLFQPSGKADIAVRTTRSRPGGPLEYRVEVEPRQVQVTPKNFSTPTKNVVGRVLVQGIQRGPGEDSSVTTRLAPLIGEWPQDARVACNAVFPTDGEDELIVLGAGVDVTNRALIGAFREAFSGGAGGGGFDLQALSVDGRIDFFADVGLQAPEVGPARNDGVYRVFLRDNSFRTEPVTRPGDDGESHGQGFGLSGLWGELVQRQGVLTGAEVQARLGSTAVLLNEARFVDQDGAVHFTTRVQARGLPLDREHLSFFLDKDTVGAAIDRLHLSGWIDFEDAELTYVGRTQRGEAKLVLSGKVRPRDAFVDLGLPLAIDRADVELQELVLEGGHVRAWARVEALDGAIASRRLESARMLVTYVEPRLSILDLSGTLEGGRISDLAQVGAPGSRERTRASGPAFTMDLLDPYTFELGLALREVELSGLLRGVFESEFADTGVLDAEIRLEGSLERLTGIIGDGYVHMRDTRLWSIPVVRDLLSQLGLDSSAVFERMKSRFTLQNGVIRMDAIHVESPLLQLVGSGKLDLDGRLEHDLQVRYSLVDRLGPLTRMLYWVQNNLLSISVRGDMARPQIVLKGMLSLLRSGKQSKRQLPLPSLSPLPERF